MGQANWQAIVSTGKKPAVVFKRSFLAFCRASQSKDRKRSSELYLALANGVAFRLWFG